MAQLVTLAHRVSSIHARYSGIHDSVFSVSLFRKLTRRKGGGDSLYAGFESDLKALAESLAEIGSSLGSSVRPEPNTTFSRKFGRTLEDYVKELTTSIVLLAEICEHRDRWQKGEAPYDSDQSRIDRTHYDESIQRHRRLGIKLSRMVERL